MIKILWFNVFSVAELIKIGFKTKGGTDCIILANFWPKSAYSQKLTIVIFSYNLMIFANIFH